MVRLEINSTMFQDYALCDLYLDYSLIFILLYFSTTLFKSLILFTVVEMFMKNNVYENMEEDNMEITVSNAASRIKFPRYWC